jgi:hypothetical protein
MDDHDDESRDVDHDIDVGIQKQSYKDYTKKRRRLCHTC